MLPGWTSFLNGPRTECLVSPIGFNRISLFSCRAGLKTTGAQNAAVEWTAFKLREFVTAGLVLPVPHQQSDDRDIHDARDRADSVGQHVGSPRIVEIAGLVTSKSHADPR